MIGSFSPSLYVKFADWFIIICYLDLNRKKDNAVTFSKKNVVIVTAKLYETKGISSEFQNYLPGVKKITYRNPVF